MSIRDRDDTRLLLDQTNKLPQGPAPEEQLLQLITGAWISQALSVAASLGIADHLAQGPRAVEEVAARTGAHAPSLYRLLRALAGVGVFSETADGRFGLTPLAEGLRTGVKGSLRAFAVFRGAEFVLRPWAGLLHTVRTGETAFNAVYGKGAHEFLAERPDAARLFDDALAGISASWGPALAAAVDLSRAVRIVDVGGGRGLFLAVLLSRTPHARGLVLETPARAEAARATIASVGLAHRCDVLAGDLLAGVPEGGDVYVATGILHDRDEARALTILRNIRRAIGMRPGRLLLAEAILPPGDTPHTGKFLDLEMLVMSGGRERTEAEWRALLAACGFRLERVARTSTPLSWIEAAPA